VSVFLFCFRPIFWIPFSKSDCVVADVIESARIFGVEPDFGGLRRIMACHYSATMGVILSYSVGFCRILADTISSIFFILRKKIKLLLARRNIWFSRCLL
jgi:hypothetical protein